jgi:hypothetical protein
LIKAGGAPNLVEEDNNEDIEEQLLQGRWDESFVRFVLNKNQCVLERINDLLDDITAK